MELNKTVEVLQCGQKVSIIMGGMDAMITAVVYRFGAIAYELVYFDKGMERKEVWCNEKEFFVIPVGSGKKIGFSIQQIK